MVCAVLLYRGTFATAADVMAYYGGKRMRNLKGVTQASQRRWVEYYEQTLRRSIRLDRPLTLASLSFCSLPRSLDLFVACRSASGGDTGRRVSVDGGSSELVAANWALNGDFCLTLETADGKPLAMLALHTAFVHSAHLSCDYEWFDLDRKNHKVKQLKGVVMQLCFADDCGFGDAGQTMPPSGKGWFAHDEASRSEGGAAPQDCVGHGE